MPSPMQIALGSDWEKLPAALQTHYAAARCRDVGHLDIDFPRWMQPLLGLLYRLGALIPRRGKGVATTVEKTMIGPRQHWQRRMRFADGQVIAFDSQWEAAPAGTIIEYVNPWLGLRMKPSVRAGQLHYAGISFILKLAGLRLPLPEWLLGHTCIVETALSEQRFSMDFRLTHPLFGEVFRYTGEFTTEEQPPEEQLGYG